jgi:hypothetical protein
MAVSLGILSILRRLARVGWGREAGGVTSRFRNLREREFRTPRNLSALEMSGQFERWASSSFSVLRPNGTIEKRSAK